jgi:outer membrane protein assembly factor BamB
MQTRSEFLSCLGSSKSIGFAHPEVEHSMKTKAILFQCRFQVSIIALLCLNGWLSGDRHGLGVMTAAESESPGAFIAKNLAELTGKSHGICAVLGAEQWETGLALGRAGDFFAHILDPHKTAAQSAQGKVDRDGLYGKRIVVEHGSFAALPYAENTVDVILAMGLTEQSLNTLSGAELFRVLTPRGVLVLGGQEVLADQVEKWARQLPFKNLRVLDGPAKGVVLAAKPALAGTDDWSHWEHGPDNNPVSADGVIKAPYMTQWMGKPYYITMPAITTAAGGRIFTAMGHIAHHQREESWLNTILARNGHNGTILWKLRLPDGYLAHRSAFIATEDTFYLIDLDGNGCLLLNPETGEEKDRLAIPGVKGEWKWMAMQDGLLYVLAGPTKDPAETTVVRSEFTHWSWGELSKGYYEKRVPWGLGTTVGAYDLKERKLLWRHEESKPIDARAMAMGGGRLFFYGPDSRAGCLDARSGKLVWANADAQVRDLIEQPGRGLTSTPGFRTECYALYTPEVLFFEAQTHMNLVALSTQDGRLLWHKRKTTSNPNMIYLEEKLLVGIGPEGSTMAIDPLKGEILEDLGFKKRSCARLTATPDSLFCRGWPEGLTRYDRTVKKVFFNGAIRPSCNDGVVPANGLIYLGPWTCDCNLSLMGQVAMRSAGDFVFERPA